jgi:hypothetical protein
MKHLRAIIFLTATLGLAACGDDPLPPGVYNIPIRDAYQRLVSNQMSELVFRRQCGILIHVRPEGVPTGKVRWTVTSSGEEVLTFMALLTPVSDKQTRVELKMQADPDNGGEMYDGNKFYRRPAFNQPLRPAVEEQVSAILEGRKFEIERVGPGKDTVCNVQRGGLESGMRFRVDDPRDPS